jgi:hypothetical protein
MPDVNNNYNVQTNKANFDLNQNFIDIDINSDHDTYEYASNEQTQSNAVKLKDSKASDLCGLHGLHLTNRFNVDDENDYDDDDDDDDDDEDDENNAFFLNQTPTNSEFKCTNLLTSTPQYSYTNDMKDPNLSTDSMYSAK